MVTRRKALERALDHIIQHAPCDCTGKTRGRRPINLVHEDDCYVGKAINIAADYDDEDADELTECAMHGVYGCPICDPDDDF